MKKLNLILVIIISLFSLNANATVFDDARAFFDNLFSATPTPLQTNVINYESFDGTTFPPTGWTQKVWNFSNSWARGTTLSSPYAIPHSGLGLARINTGTNLSGNPVEYSWLITPSFDLTSGQGVVSFWMYRSIDAPGAPDSLGIWVNTVADTVAGATLQPIGQVKRAASFNGWYQYSFLIPASYNGAANYVLFKACGYGGANIAIDDVTFGVPSAMTYVSGTVINNTNPVTPNSVNNHILGIPVITTGTNNPFNVTKFKLRTTGSTNPASDIRNARIYYTGKYNTFTVSPTYAAQYGNVITNPNGNFEISGAQTLTDTNYFWLTYDVTPGAGSGDTIYAVCDSIIGTNLGSVSPTPGIGGRIINTPIPGGTYVIGPGQTAPNYPTFTAAFADLSVRGISGPVVFNVKPAVYGTDAGVEIDSSVTLNTVYGASNINTITFKKKSNEAGEVYLERYGTASGIDNILTLNGVSYATFDSINVRQKDTLTYNQVEAGYSLKTASSNIGSSYNTIRNTKIFLKASNINSVGIRDTVSYATSLLTGVNSYNKYQNNTITNCYSGIKLYGYGATPPYYTNGRYNEITGNTITGFGGLATAANGIYTNLQMFIRIDNNTIISGTGSTNAIYGIQIAGNNFGNVDVISNTVTLSSGTSTGIISPIYVQGTPGNSASIRSHCNIQNNTVKDLNLPATNTGAFYGIYAAGSNSPDTMNVTGNVIKNSTIGTSNAICAMYYVQGATVNLNVSNDSVYNVIKNSSSTNLYYIYSGASLGVNGTAKIYNNYIANDSVTAGVNIYAIYDNGSANANNYFVYNNTINNISSSVSTIFYGIYTNTGNNRSIYNNNVNRLTNYNASNTARIHGLYINSGQFIYAYNNSISNLRMPAGVDSNAVTGIFVNGPVGPANIGLYYNSIYLADTSSSVTYGNSGIYCADTMRVDIRNNNVVNLSKSGGTGRNSAVALRMGGVAALRNYQSTNGNNNWYSSGLIYYDITNSFTNAQFSNFMGYMNPREQGSVYENSPFIDAYGGNLHINTGSGSLTYRGGLPVATPIPVTYDFDGNTRNLTYTSIGFDEYSGTSAIDVVAPVIYYERFGNGNTTNRTLSGIVITDPSKIDTSANRPRVYYKKTTNANTFNDNTNATDGWKYASANGTTGSPFNFTINYSLLFGGSVTTGDTVQYFITAQDIAVTPNVGINSGMFTTTPANVNLTAANFPLLGNINKYAVTGSYTNTINVGSSETITSLTSTGGLFDLINKGVITGNITAVVTSNLVTESGKVGLKAWSEQMAPTQYSLRIIPDGTTERIISGWYTYGNSMNDTMGLIRFAGASKVTIDGGSGKYLRIRNNSRGAAINFNNGATFDTVKNCTIESLGDQTGSVLRYSPIIFTYGSLTQGNSFNVVANNVIRERSDTLDVNGKPIPLYMAILSEGRGINSQNTNNLIYGNEITNFTQGGIFLTSTGSGNGNGWTLRKNSFYFNIPTISFTYQFMPINASLGIFGGLTIDSNYIGGTASNCGGNYFYSQNPGNIFIMSVSAGYDSITTINANTIQNIRSYPGQGSTLKFNGITTSQGWMDIKGNIFGSSDTSKTIVYNGNLQLINASNGNNGVIRPLIIRNNVATNIFTRHDSVITTMGGSYQRNMILTNGNAPVEISGNVLTHIYSWQTPGNTPASSYFTKLDGITISSQQKVVVKNNIISDFGNKATIPYTSGKKNFVYAIENVGGLGDSSLIANNRISGIFTSNTEGGNDIVAGIVNTGGISNAINVYFVNNQISMTNNQSNFGLVFGIYDPGTGFYTSTSNYFNNTVLLSGASTSEQPSYSYFKDGSSSPQYAVLKNNVFYNGRTNPNISNLAMGVSNYGLDKNTNSKGDEISPRMGGSPTVNSDYNLFVTVSSNRVCDWYGTFYSFDKWKSIIGYDANSLSDTSANIPGATLFRNISTGDLNIDTTQYGAAYVYKEGIGIAGITTDYNGYPRNVSGPVNIGSHEFTLSKNTDVTLLIPANNAVDVVRPVNMVWSKALFATGYRIQIATDDLFNNIVVETNVTDSTYLFTTALPITYSWRVNPRYTSINGSFSTVFKFTAAAVAPNVPVLAIPVNGATGQPQTITFQWYKAIETLNATLKKDNKESKNESDDPKAISKYWFEYGTDPTLATVIARDSSLTDTTKVVSGLNPITQYYWRVKAKNQIGWGGFSAIWNFTTALPIPSAPTLLLPANNSVDLSVTPTLDWNDVTYATSYRVQISTSNTFGTTVYDTAGLTVSTIVVPSGKLTTNTQYYWRVNATNANGTSAYSTVFAFTTAPNAPNGTILALPTNGATGQPTTVTFKWYKAIETLVDNQQKGKSDKESDDPLTISKYWFEYGTDPTLATVLARDSSLTDTTKILSGLATGTTYYWRVKAKNQTGWGSFSSIWSFSTLVPTLSLNLKVYLEGFWGGTTQVTDTVMVYLASSTTPYAYVDTAKVVLSATGTASMNFNRVTTGSYYIVVNHRNHLETWSKLPQSFVGGTPLSYDFTTAATQAYGDNMKQVGSVWVLIGGDANRDGSIDAGDIGIFVVEFGMLGYLSSDFNGDEDVNAADVSIIANNFGLIKITPGVEPLSPEVLRNKKMQIDKAVKNSTEKNRKNNN